MLGPFSTDTEDMGTMPDAMPPGMMGEDQPAGDYLAAGEEQPPPSEADQMAAIPDSKLLAIFTNAYHIAKESRTERKFQNNRNWKALHGDFAFLRRKQPGQSRIVIPALETSMEQVCGQLTSQLVGYDNWFSCEYEGGDPPLPELGPDIACEILRRELERLQVEGNYLATMYGAQRLVYDSLKVGLVEGVVTWKVTVKDVEQTEWQVDANDPTGTAPPTLTTKVTKRLHVEIIPWDDHYPDPSPARMYDIHEVEVPVSDLPAMGFTDEQVRAMRGLSASSEKEEQRRVRAGTLTVQNVPKHRVILREYWGDLVDPDTGELLARNAMFTVCGTSLVVKKPVPISSIFWHGRRPFITTPLIPTPLSHVHHAFLDIAVPLVETESELVNLIIDGGFSAVHGIKEVREYMLENPEVLSKGFVPGMTLKIAEGHGDKPAVTRVDTGTISEETLQVAEKIGNMRQEAFRINDLQLGRLPPRKESATAITEITDASNDLFSTIAIRFEDSGIEPLVELSWLTIWQFMDDFGPGSPLAAILGPDHAAAMLAATQAERFAIMANGVRFKVEGYKYQQAAAKQSQKLITLQNFVGQNPALLDIWQQEFSPTKQFRMLYRSLGIDPITLRRGPDEPYMNPQLLQGQAGNPQGGPPQGNPAASPGMPSPQQTPNPMGERGVQAP